MQIVDIRVSLRTYESDGVTIESYCDFTFSKPLPFVPRTADLIQIGDVFYKVANAVIFDQSDFLIACVPQTFEDESGLFEAYAHIKAGHDVRDMSTNMPDTPSYYLIYRTIADLFQPDLTDKQHKLIVTDLLRLILRRVGIIEPDYVKLFLELVLRNPQATFARTLMLWSRRLELACTLNDGLLALSPSEIVGEWKQLPRPSIDTSKLPKSLQ